MRDAVRTPEERFAGIRDYDYPPSYVDDLPGYEGLRLHLVDEGVPRGGATYLCLHGEPTWGYLYRRMLPVFLEDGGRIVVPDFFGFGRSDKPVDETVYTFDFHRATLLALIRQRNLRDITLVCQDWGGILGLTLIPEMPERFARILVMNTTVATGEGPPSDGFVAWRRYVHENPGFSIPALMARACPELTDEELAAYEAPFPDERHRAGVRSFPAIVPTAAAAAGAALGRRARDWLRDRWTGATFMAVGARDPVLGVPVMERLRGWIRGCPEPWIIEEAGHFVPEHGAEIARRVLEAWSH